MVGEVAARHGADRVPHAAARAVAPDDVFRADRPFFPARGVRQGDAHGMVAGWLDREAHELPAVIGREPRRRLVHVVFEVAQQARLVDDHMRELGQPVLGVLHAPGPDDRRPVVGRRAPEHRFVHPIGFADELLAQAERVEHLDRAAGDAVRLADLQRAVAAVDDARRDAGKGRELCRQQHPGRAGADDEDVHGIGQARRTRLDARGGRVDVGITGRVAVEVELHALGSFRARGDTPLAVS